jgi:hypothetical protein
MSTLSEMFECSRRWVNDRASKSLIECFRELSEVKDELLAILKSPDGHFGSRKMQTLDKFF